MESDLNAAQLSFAAALQALQKGDRRTARRQAEQAAALAPQVEQPWLLLAFLASPRAAQYYLDRALQVNPSSQRALEGKAWLKKQADPAGLAQPAGPKPPGPPSPAGLPRTGTGPRSGIRFLVLLVLLAALGAGLAALGGPARLAESFPGLFPARAGRSALPVSPTRANSPVPGLTWTGAPAGTATPPSTVTLTASPVPSNTASPVPTETASPAPTETPSPTPTETASPTPTGTSIPTELPITPSAEAQLPSPTPLPAVPAANQEYTVVAGDTLSLIAQRFSVSVQGLIAANNLPSSVIRVGQVLTIPAAGQPEGSAPTPASNPGSSSGLSKEILVDISEQHMYAYQDGELVFSFVVSTGIGDSTRIGTFKVLDKIPRAYSSRFNIWMPYWLGIYFSGTLENGIHGLPLLMNGVELWGDMLGRPATYGCVEATTREIKQLYDWAEIGTPVIIRR